MSRPDTYTPSELLQHLAQLGIEATTIEHPPVFTVEEAKRLRGKLPGANCKSLFLKNKKHEMWLVVLLEDQRVSLDRLADALGSKRLSFASPERLLTHLGITPGAVSPLAVINDQPGSVRVVISAAVMEHDLLNFHPLVNDRTTTLSRRDFLVFLESTGHPPLLLAADAL